MTCRHPPREAPAPLSRRLATVALVTVLCVPWSAGAQDAGGAPAQGAGTADAPHAPEAPSDAPGVRFDIHEFRVAGNSVLPAPRIEEVLYPYLGPGADFQRVAAAQAALAEEYRRTGYAAATVDIPEQELSGGVVRLLVVEGVVERLRVTGARYVSARRLAERLPSLRSGAVFHLPSAQRELSALAAESRRLTPALQAGSAPGTVEVELLVDDALPWRAGLTLSNQASANTSDTRLNVDVGYGNLFQRDHAASLSWQVTPERRDEVNAVVASYVARFRDSPAVLALFGVRTNSDVSAAGGVGVLGKGTVLGARYIVPLDAPAGGSRSFTAGVDWKDFGDTTSVAGAELLTDIEYWKAMLAFSASSRGEASATRVDVGIDLAMRHSGNRRSEFEDKRFKGESDFFYVSAALRHERRLPLDWRAIVELSGRLTEDPLVSNEQYALGGLASVRGYLESEALMDLGAGLRLTLARSLLPSTAGSGDAAGAGAAPASWSGGWRRFLRTLDAGLYVDWQGGWLHEPLPDTADHLYLLAAGAGVSATGPGGAFGSLDLALPLRDGPFTDACSPRLLFEFGYEL